MCSVFDQNYDSLHPKTNKLAVLGPYISDWKVYAFFFCPLCYVTVPCGITDTPLTTPNSRRRAAASS